MGNIVAGSVLEGKKHIHFIGIGGSGMFPLVQILHAHGFYITGSDNNETETIKIERNMGITVYMGHSADNIKGADLIVYTAAILPDNVELMAAKAGEAPAIERSELLGAVSAAYSEAVCVSGTHGKTTTTAMITQILMTAGIDPTVVLGGKLKSIGGSGRVGTGEVMVCEACEFVDTFLKLHPYVSLILNVEEDHLDYFGTLENIVKSFSKFASLASGCVVVNGDDENAMKAVENAKNAGKKIVTFGWSEKNDYYPANIDYKAGKKSEFTLMQGKNEIAKISLNIPGEYNILNAVAACVSALVVGASSSSLVEGLKKFYGTKRRFEILSDVGGVTIADDYAHNPKELEVTLSMAKELGYKRVWAVFQPFTYSRTSMLFDGFVKSLSIADRVVLTEIMGSREKNTYNIYSEDLRKEIDGALLFEDFEKIAQYVVDNAQSGDLVITLGCGDVYKCADIMVDKMRGLYGERK